MQFHQCLTVVMALGSMTQAFLIPEEGKADGVYAGTFDENGIAVIRKIADSVPMPKGWTPKASLSRFALQKRALPEKIVCEHVTLTRNDVGQAAFNLGQTCDTGTPVLAANYLYAINGAAVVYDCNPTKNNQTCSTAVVNSDVAAIEKKCPVVRGGYFVYNLSPIHSLGYTSIQKKICRNWDNVPHGPAQEQLGAVGRMASEAERWD